MIAQTPPGFPYNFELVVHDPGGAPVIWHIAGSEYVIMASFRFLEPARDGAIGIAGIHHRWASITGMSSFCCHAAFAVDSMVTAFSQIFKPVVIMLSSH